MRTMHDTIKRVIFRKTNGLDVFCDDRFLFLENFATKVLDMLTLILWKGYRPQQSWHSWDAEPWKHPWLINENLHAMRIFSEGEISRARQYARQYQNQKLDLGAVCNMANNIYLRLGGLKKLGVKTTVYPHPQDNYAMSFPAWEEFDGTLDNDNLNYDEIENILPTVEGFVQIPNSKSVNPDDLSWLRLGDAVKWPLWILNNFDLCAQLRSHDVLWSTQAPYLAYLSGQKYIVTQTGGDAWLECSRDDELGKLQHQAFEGAEAFFANNPWSYSFSRRYGWTNTINLPFYLDDERYSPGFGSYREEWKAQTGGDFFILVTSRLDNLFKANLDMLQALAEFTKTHKGAKVVVMDWGKDGEIYKRKVAEIGLQEKVISLPLVGKRRLIEYYRSADCLVDQFRLGYFGSTAIEAMACGLPVIMRLETEQYTSMTGRSAAPVLNAPNAKSIVSLLAKLADNKTYCDELSTQHRKWFMENNSSSVWAPVYRDILVAVANGFKFNFDKSPLQAPLGAEEKEYHARQLKNAPTFPNYSDTTA